jgi:uncharacterized membrane protein YhaH (DUF805 family)
MSRSRIGVFLIAAVLVRCMDAGATVGMVLLCSATHMASPLRTAGLVGAALSAPHALGFLSAPLLDRGADPRRVVAASAALFAALLALATMCVGSAPLPVVLLLALGAGTAGPMLTGGLSSLVEGRAADDRTRRLRAIDALTYALAGAGAPVVISVLAGVGSPRGALYALSALGVAGGLLVFRLPAARPAPTGRSRSGLAAGLSAVWRHSRLRRVALLTWLGAFFAAGAVLAGISLGEEHAAGGGGWVAAAFGTGSLVSALALTVHPLRVAPDRGMALFLAAFAPVLAAVVVFGRWFPALLGAYAVLGLVVTPLTVLSLAARAEYAPPNARGSAFVTVAGTKVAFSSAGTALAGLAAGWGSRSTLIACAAAALVTGALARADQSARPVPGRFTNLTCSSTTTSRKAPRITDSQ